MERKLCFTADEKLNNKTLRQVFANELALSHTCVTRLKKNPAGILVNGQAVFVSYTLRPGDKVELLLAEKEEASAHVEPVFGPLCILYEDEDILVVDKEAKVPVHPSQNHHGDTLANFVAWYYGQKGESLIFRPVNRLDANTSGIVLIAKNAHAGSLLNRRVQAGEMRKEYRAIVEGVAPAEGVIDAPIGRAPGSVIGRQVQEGGKEALTLFWREEVSNGMSLLRVETKTGRTHQIRVHLAHIGHPLVGDFLYGKEEPERMDRHALHMGAMSFSHPVTKKALRFTSPMPSDMERLLREGRI